MALEAEPFGEHETELRTLINELQADLETLSKSRGPDVRVIQVSKRRAAEAEDLLTRTRHETVSERQKKRVKGYVDDLTKLKQQLTTLERVHGGKSERETLLTRGSPVATYGVQAEESPDLDEDKASSCSCTNLICYVVFDGILECFNDCRFCCKSCPENCLYPGNSDLD